MAWWKVGKGWGNVAMHKNYQRNKQSKPNPVGMGKRGKGSRGKLCRMNCKGVVAGSKAKNHQTGWGQQEGGGGGGKRNQGRWGWGQPPAGTRGKELKIKRKIIRNSQMQCRQ